MKSLLKSPACFTFARAEDGAVTSDHVGILSVMVLVGAVVLGDVGDGAADSADGIASSLTSIETTNVEEYLAIIGPGNGSGVDEYELGFVFDEEGGESGYGMYGAYDHGSDDGTGTGAFDASVDNGESEGDGAETDGADAAGSDAASGDAGSDASGSKKQKDDNSDANGKGGNKHDRDDKDDKAAHENAEVKKGVEDGFDGTDDAKSNNGKGNKKDK